MRLMVGEGGDHIEISELYCGVALSTNEGEKIGICQRDGIFEISILKSKSGNPIRIMSAAPKAVELAATTANTGSPKLPTREQFISWLATFESAPTAMSVYEWLCRQLRASA